MQICIRNLPVRCVRIFPNLENEAKDSRQLIKSMQSGESNMLVAVRVRPLNSKETYLSNFETLKLIGNNELLVLDPQFELAEEEVYLLYHLI